MKRIGIDVGVFTGFARSYNGELCDVKSCTTVEAQSELLEYCKNRREPGNVIVYVEDARLRKWVTGGREKLQGAGAIKIQCKLWEEWLTYHEFEFVLVAPKDNITKLSAEKFKQITGWDARTNQHGRDAAMLIFGKK